MRARKFDGVVWVAVLFWALAALSIVPLLKVQTLGAGWDTNVYRRAIESVRAGRDPYADGMAVQRAKHAEMLLHPDQMPPYTYVYSPMTLPVVRAVARFPLRWMGLVYWSVYALAMIAVPCALLLASEPWERKAFLLLAPAAPFFPGLLQTNVFFSGNIAYILYALVFGGAWLGWKRGVWWPFYAATLAASVCKAPLLTLLLLPVLSARAQWVKAAATGVAGLALFAVQPVVWPELMRHYLEAVELQFSYNHDFGVSPAGLFGNALYFAGKPYSVGSTVFYLLYGAVVLGVLVLLARRYFAGAFSLQQWIPVLLTGVILLNPRIKEYDTAVIALPMGYLLWRVFRRWAGRHAVWMAFALFGALNVCAITVSENVWKPLETALLVGLFALGAWQLSGVGDRRVRGAWAVEREHVVVG